MAAQPSSDQCILSAPDQQTLSEQLQLLHELHYSDHDMQCRATGPYPNMQVECLYMRTADTDTDLRILDVITVALATGEPGEVVAATFDKSERLSLVLAMNRPPTREDEDATARLIAIITDPATRNAFGVFPFLLLRCLENLNKRISDLHQSISDFLPDLHSALPHYTLGSLEKELPHSAIYRKGVYKGEEPDFSTIISKLVLHISDTSDSPLDPDDVDASTRRYSLLDNLAKILLHSPFLKSLCEAPSPENSERYKRAERLKRRLAKVCQYFGGVTQLVKMAKRLFPDGIPYRWVSDTFVDSGEGQVHLSNNYVGAMQRACGAETPPSPDALETLAIDFPELRVNWEDRRIVNAFIHAEVRIVQHFSKPLPPSDPYVSWPPRPMRQRAIGCSNRSCLCCTLWIDAYNAEFGTRWLTNGCDGKPCATWALPGDAATHGTGVDEAVVHGVETRLAETLWWLYPDSSDEGSDSDAEARVDIALALFNRTP